MTKDSMETVEFNDSALIDHLNEDCLIEIFQYLPIIDRIIIERVCKKWCDVAKKSWKSFRVLDFRKSTWGLNYIKRPIKLNSKTVDKVLDRCGYFLTRVDFEEGDDLTDDTLVEVGKFCVNLRTIIIPESILTIEGLQSLAENCEKIVNFTADLGECSEDKKEIIKCLSKLFKNNRNLERIELSSVYIDGKFFSSLSSDSIKEITLEHVENPFFSDEFVFAISKFKHLKKLNINIITSFLPRRSKANERNILRAISFCSSTVEEFRLNCFNSSLDYQYFAHFSNLKRLNMSHCIYVMDNFLVAISKFCTQLEMIDISFCYNVTNVGLNYITNLLNLEELYIDYLVNITDDSLRFMPKLKHLRSRDCPDLRDPGLCSLIDSAKELKLLDLTMCKNISNELIEHAVQSTKQRTNKVVLKILARETAVDFAKIVNSSPLLQVEA